MSQRQAKEQTRAWDEIVGQNVQTLRKRLGHSQDWLAQKLGISYQQVQKYEKGHNRVSAGRLYEISMLLNVNIDWFFRGCEGGDDRAIGTLGEDQVVIAELATNFNLIRDPAIRTGISGMVKEAARAAITLKKSA